MLRITDGRSDKNCEGTWRRDFLKIGALGLGGLTLADLLGFQARARAAGITVKDRAIVLLFLQGGPSHIELFDPKMTAPSSYRSIFGEVKTTLPGITFGGHFSRLARLAHKITVVRSFASGNSGHTYRAVASGRNRLNATMGSIYSRVVGINNPRTGIPSNVLVTPEGVQAGLELKRNFETQALPTLTDPGSLGDAFRAFNPAGSSTLKDDMELRIPQSRFVDRRTLLDQLDRYRRGADDGALSSVDGYHQQAFDVIARGVGTAFDLSREDPRVLERYDTSHLFTNEEVQKWGDMRRSTNLLGRQMLLARRLCEAGCGFVTVSDCGWDMHSNGNSPKGLGGMKFLGPQIDHAVSAFVEDVERRGLTDKILLIVTGEMGRTPRINRNGGRDHYGNLTPLLVFGGGLKMGQVIGRSDRNATVPATRRYGPENLLATVMHSLFDLGQIRVQPDLAGEVASAITDGAPIEELL